MLDETLDRFARTVTRRRRLVIAAVVGVTVFCASQLPRLTPDPSPEKLILSHGGYEDEAREFRARFGDTDSVVALLVAADDVTTQPVLQYVHRLSLHFRGEPSVVRVESLTVTPLPGALPPDAATETLDELGETEELAPSLTAALEVLMASEPERFPMGLLSVANRVGDGRQDLRGVVRGEEVTAAEAEAIAAAIDDTPLVLGRLVSRERRLAAVVLFLDPALGTGPARIDAVHAIDAWLAASPPPRGASIHAAGLPHVRAAIQDAMIADQTFLVPLALLLCALLLYASFRWVAGVILPIAMVAMSVVCVIGTMALIGEPLSILMNTLPTLLIIMGISEAVHVVGRYTEESRRTRDRVEAAGRTLRKLMVACFLTSFTTAIGFGSLVVAETDHLQRFGVAAALGVMVTYALLITFIPAVISYFPRPVVRQARRAGWLEAWLVRATAAITRRPAPILLGTLLVMVPCGYGYGAIDVDTALLETFDEDDPIAVSTRLVERHLDGILPLEIHLRSDGRTDVRDPAVLAALDRVARWAEAQEGVLRTSAPADLLWASWRRIAGVGASEPRTAFRSREQVDALITLLDRIAPNPTLTSMTSDGRHARLEVRLADIGAQRSIALIAAIEARARRELAHFEGLEVALLGEAFISSHGVTAVVDDLFGSLALSALLIFVTIGVLFRSARLGVLAIPPNLIPQVGTVGWMILRGVPLNAGTAIVFSVAIGVSVDLTIHGFARLVEEERRGMNRRAALLRVARSTGRAMVMSCATLVLGFSVLMLSGFVPVRHFGELIAVALTLSLATTLVFQPAMMMRFGGPGRSLVTHRAPAGSVSLELRRRGPSPGTAERSPSERPPPA